MSQRYVYECRISTYVKKLYIELYMIRLYFQQALYHLRENPIITWVSVIGTALAICMIMVLVITLQVRIVDCEPEVNRSRTLYVSAMSAKQKGDEVGISSNARISFHTGLDCF